MYAPWVDFFNLAVHF
jgi:7,8-dihydro-6-hydroxymethylpterin-pyrophosphokinase